MTTSKDKASASKKNATKVTSPDHKDLETEFPLSEKDEVKKAEQSMNKTAKKK